MALGRRKTLATEGSRAPDFRLPKLDGGEISLQEILAKGPALLAFFKISCPVCQFTFPFLERIAGSGRLSVYGISQNGAGETRKFNSNFEITFPTLLDQEENDFAVSNAYGISTVPTLFLVEADGSIVKAMEGWNRQEVARLAALSGVNPFLEGEYVPEWKSG
jgi:peroxiredoxin